nr:uncharacterized protein LOC115256082 [Aedes albopictus]
MGKMLMQKLWLLPCVCDDPVPDYVAFSWEELAAQIPKVTTFRISRYALLPNASIHLHTFSDASEKAYGACTYARYVDSSGMVRIQLLASKSRVAPLRKITLPRLELCAADIGAKLHSRIVQALEMPIASSHLWSDSAVTLQWLQAPPRTWKTFVGNGGIRNPGTYALRFLEPRRQQGQPSGPDFPRCERRRFLGQRVWQRGPKWLSLAEEHWPVRNIPPYPVNGKECRKLITTVARIQEASIVNPVFVRYSSYERLLHITAYIIRFLANVRCKARSQPLPSTGSPPGIALSVDHLINGFLIQLAQADAFREEVRDLHVDKAVGKRSSTRLLAPFLDSEGIIRVGGSLRLSDQPFLAKHPALLPSNHPLARLIAKSYHLALIHGGGRLTLAAMREKFWPIHGRLVRSVLRSCYRCARANFVPTSQHIGQLPLHRITPGRPSSSEFHNTSFNRSTASQWDDREDIYLLHRLCCMRLFICLRRCVMTPMFIELDAIRRSKLNPA